MTVLVGLWCKDGVVIGTDSAMTFEASAQQLTIEQPLHRNIDVIADRIVVAGTGQVGLGQRFVDTASMLWAKKSFQEKSAVDIGRLLAHHAIEDFQSTSVVPGSYGALVAVPRGRRAELIEFSSSGFQPEVKGETNWYVSMGAGQSIADPLLGFIRAAFWKDEPPNRREGLFFATMVLKLACDMAPLGVAAPVQLAVLEPDRKGQLFARILTRDELGEHEDNVESAMAHFRGYRSLLHGSGSPIPRPPT